MLAAALERPNFRSGIFHAREASGVVEQPRNFPRGGRQIVAGMAAPSSSK